MSKQWPVKLRKVRITGGPSPANIELQLDGEPLDKVSSFVLRAEVDDVMVLETRRTIQVDVEADAYVRDHGYVARISLQGAFGIAATLLGEGSGETVGQAVSEALMTVTNDRILEAEQRIDDQLARAREARGGVRLGGEE